MSRGDMPWPTHVHKAKQRIKLKYRKKRREKLRRDLEKNGKRVIQSADGI